MATGGPVQRIEVVEELTEDRVPQALGDYDLGKGSGGGKDQTDPPPPPAPPKGGETVGEVLQDFGQPLPILPHVETSIAVMREEARRDIAVRLIWLLVGIIAAAFVLGAAILAIEATGTNRSSTSGGEIDILLRVLEIVFGPVVALVAGAVGFYFGSREESTSR